MPSMSPVTLAAVLVLGALASPASSQWAVTPPTPPSEWRQIEIPLPQPRAPATAGQGLQGAPGDNGNGENGNAVQQPNAACPYQERKLELLV